MNALFFGALGWPMALAAAGLIGPIRRRLAHLLWLAPLPALVLAVQGDWNIPVRIGPLALQLDPSSAMLLATASTLWLIAGAVVPAWFRARPPGAQFSVCWLLTLAGSMGVFVATDLLGFLIFYALVSLPAYGLVIHEGSAEVQRAGRVYLGFALLGENLLLLAFVLLATSHGGAAAVALLLVGFGMKMGLLPMHFWMPLSYGAAPIPAAAVLSGAAVKAGVIGMLRFLPIGIPLPTWGEALTMLGFCGAFFGVAVGLTQRNPKTVLAYSSISQMGFLAAVIGMGLSSGDVAAIPLAAFYASNHVLAKGALFLAAGAGKFRPILTLAPATLVGLSLAGLPLTGGALAKLAVKDPLGYGIAAVLASLSAVGTATLMLHFVRCLHDARATQARTSAGMLAAWLASAFACLAFPWFFLPLAGMSPADALAPDAIWKTLWPVAVGCGLFLVLRKRRLPEIPAGDILVCGRAICRLADTAARQVERADTWLRHWPVACMSLLAAVIALAVALCVKM